MPQTVKREQQFRLYKCCLQFASKNKLICAFGKGVEIEENLILFEEWHRRAALAIAAHHNNPLSIFFLCIVCLEYCRLVSNIRKQISVHPRNLLVFNVPIFKNWSKKKKIVFLAKRCILKLAMYIFISTFQSSSRYANSVIIFYRLLETPKSH